MRNQMKKMSLFLAMVMLIGTFFGTAMPVYAAGAEITELHFTTDQYNPNNLIIGQEVPVGVTDEGIRGGVTVKWTATVSGNDAPTSGKFVCPGFWYDPNDGRISPEGLKYITPASGNVTEDKAYEFHLTLYKHFPENDEYTIKQGALITLNGENVNAVIDSSEDLLIDVSSKLHKGSPAKPAPAAAPASKDVGKEVKTSAGETLVSSIPGNYRVTAVDGLAITTPLSALSQGISAPAGAAVRVEVIDSQCGVAAKKSIEDGINILQSVGFNVNPVADIDLLAYVNEEKVLNSSIPFNVKIGVPSGTDGSLCAILVQEGGIVTFFNDTDNDPNTASFDINGFGVLSIVSIR